MTIPAVPAPLVGVHCLVRNKGSTLGEQYKVHSCLPLFELKSGQNRRTYTQREFCMERTILMFYFYGDIGQVRPLQNVFVCFLFARRLRLITEEKSKYREQPRLKILRNFWDKIQNIKFDS